MRHEPVTFIPRVRLEMFSDLIFGLSLSISALTLIGPASLSQQVIIARIIAFMFNFIILIMVWLRYTGTMAILPMETGFVIFLNLLLLLLVGIEPFLLTLIQDTLFITGSVPVEALALAPFAGTLYALDLAGLVAIQGLFTHILSREEALLVPPKLLRSYRVARNVQFIVSLLFLVTAHPFLWTINVSGLPLTIELWLIPLFASAILIIGKYGFGGPVRE